MMKRIIAFLFSCLFIMAVLTSSTAEEVETITCGDFEYRFNEDKETVTLIRYIGNDSVITVPAELDEHPVTVIGDNAFYFKTFITELTISEGIVSIEQNAFISCTELKKVFIPDSVRNIGTASFINCSSLVDLRMSSNLETLGDFAFLNCTSLEEVEFGPELKVIGESAFQLCTSLKNIILPPVDQVLIPDSAFRDCSDSLEFKVLETVSE